MSEYRAQSHEQHHVSPELYFPHQQAQQFVGAMANDRTDKNGYTLPLEVEHTRLGAWGEMQTLPSTIDNTRVFPPERMVWKEPRPGGDYIDHRYAYSYTGMAYDNLVGMHTLRFKAPGVVRVQRQLASLQGCVENSRKYESIATTHQLNNALHIVNKYSTADGKLAAPLRLYVPAATHAPAIAEKLIRNGADFKSAKLWVPFETTAKQSFRADTLMLSFSNMGQLRSSVSALRRVVQEQGLPASKQAGFAGMAIPGIPGAYLGQHHKNNSFNGEMDDLMGTAFAHAVSKAPLRPGQKIPEGWTEFVASEMQRSVQRLGPQYNRSTQSHALVAGQDTRPIVDAIAY
jgi:hypothetical protein